MEESQPIMVSIRCLVYNHEPYLRDCLDGFVMQNTNFRFEAVVHDDASTDGSAAIIREYADKYPHIIKPIYEIENQYSKQDGTLYRIVNDACVGKYHAFCEGDDYWTDPLKLQKQVNFLESHPEYSLCFHNAINRWEDKSQPDSIIMTGNQISREYHVDEIFDKWFYATASFVYRKEVANSPVRLKFLSYKGIVGDVPLILSASTVGKIYGFADVMSVYRRHNGGWSAQGNFCLTVYKSELAEATIIGGNLPKILAKHLADSYIPLSLNNAIFMHDSIGLYYLLKNYPAYYWPAMMKGAYKFIKDAIIRKSQKLFKSHTKKLVS